MQIALHPTQCTILWYFSTMIKEIITMHSSSHFLQRWSTVLYHPSNISFSVSLEKPQCTLSNFRKSSLLSFLHLHTLLQQFPPFQSLEPFPQESSSIFIQSIYHPLQHGIDAMNSIQIFSEAHHWQPTWGRWRGYSRGVIPNNINLRVKQFPFTDHQEMTQLDTIFYFIGVLSSYYNVKWKKQSWAKFAFTLTSITENLLWVMKLFMEPVWCSYYHDLLVKLRYGFYFSSCLFSTFKICTCM